MTTITITFEYPQACVPKYKFGDRIAVKDNCASKHWLTGEVIGMTLEKEIFKPRWWYSVLFDFPPGYTEDFEELELIPFGEIAREQVEFERSLADDIQSNHHAPLPKFQPGMQVRLNAERGFSNLIKDCAVVVSSRYVCNESWSGWAYLLTNENFTTPVEIGEIWLELVPTTVATN